MVDLTKCSGVKYTSECPHKESCYRHTVEGNPMYQSYFSVAPFQIDLLNDIPVVTCDMFYSNGN